MNEKRRKLIMIISTSVLTLVVFVGVTYALFDYYKTGNKTSKLILGDIYMKYNGGNKINLTNVLPSDTYDPNKYFEFTITGKNTNTVYDIIYDIVLEQGDSVSGKSIRIDNKFIKLRLVQVVSGNENVIVDGKRYSDLYLNRIKADKIAKNTTTEISRTYRLYVWVSTDVLIGNVEGANYSSEEWKNDVYASFTVDVTGDFNDKQTVPDYLRVATNTDATGTFLYSDLIKNTIEKIIFTNTKEVPSDVLGSFDASAKRNNSIMSWYYDSDENGLYEVYIGGDGGVYANPTSSTLFYYLTSLKEIDFTYFKVTSDVTNMSAMFFNATSLTNVGDLSNWDTSNVTNMYRLFAQTKNLISVGDLSKWDTSKVTKMLEMFSNAASLISLDLSKWNTSSVTDMQGMFASATSIISVSDLGNWDTSKVMNTSYMFYNASSLTNLDLSKWNTSSVTNMSSMFYNASSLVSLDLSKWNTSSVINMSNMFYNSSSLVSLDLSKWNTSSVTNMSSMFFKASSLVSLDVSKWNTSSVTFMSSMFYGASSLISLDLSGWDTSNVTNMAQMFYGASSLTSLDLSNFDTLKVTDMSYMFSSSNGIVNLNLSAAVFSSVINKINMFYITNFSLKVTVKDQAAYDFISPLLSTAQRSLLTIKS